MANCDFGQSIELEGLSGLLIRGLRHVGATEAAVCA
jgi:hypothetical protein